MQGQSFKVGDQCFKVVADDNAHISIALDDGQPFTVKNPLLVLDALMKSEVKYWLDIWAEKDKHIITSDWHCYMDGHLYGDKQLHGRGFGGAYFKYHTTDGYWIETWNMWSQDIVPELFRPLFFINCNEMIRG